MRKIYILQLHLPTQLCQSNTFGFKNTPFPFSISQGGWSVNRWESRPVLFFALLPVRLEGQGEDPRNVFCSQGQSPACLTSPLPSPSAAKPTSLAAGRVRAIPSPRQNEA